FDPFRDELGQPVVGTALARRQRRPLQAGLLAHVLAALEVALARALRHRRQRTHAAIGLERAALVENRLAWALIDTGEPRSHHAHAGPCRYRLGDVARVLDAAVGDDRNPALAGRAEGLRDRRDLRHTRSG